MQKLLSGSSGNLVSSMHFLDTGELFVEHFDDAILDSYEEATLTMTQEFLFYSLGRDDWMKEFLGQMNSRLQKQKKESDKLKFTVIEGGLSSSVANN